MFVALVDAAADLPRQVRHRREDAAREREFRALTDEEAARIEALYGEFFGGGQPG
jgi:hypothetical protein